MSNHDDAFDISPVPRPGPDAAAPEPYRGIYAMPMFVTVPSEDLDASVDFWTTGLGFINLFSIPGQVVHLRRWAFQDVLLVPSSDATTPGACLGITVSFACVLAQLDEIVARALDAGARDIAPARDTPWSTRDVEVITPEGVRVVLTAARPYDPDSQEARNLAEAGIVGPR